MEFVAYPLYDHMPVDDPQPASIRREWMQATPNRFANRCLPLLIANQSGWEIRQRGTFTATWLGGAGFTDIDVVAEGDGGWLPFPHFGRGLLTWHIPWRFETPPGWNLLIRGPANHPKDGVASLEGILETDWMTQSTTYSTQLTRQGHPVTWEDGEPVCMVLPVKRDDLEEWTPVVRPMPPEVQRELAEFTRSRGEFNAGPREGKDWQGMGRGGYFTGSSPGGSTAPEGQHRTNRKLRRFANE